MFLSVGAVLELMISFVAFVMIIISGILAFVLDSKNNRS